ncbi:MULTISPECIES: guanylate kinase [Peptoniphilus]|uniref:guanylate kinase n=1 Tax=Peptoniphilus TaxID=162289 RepID=UPI0001DA9A55|nr:MULTISPECIES: AAA family ATPase [Peptoniphilus]EFI41903.1 putative guanylate kinase [Peptoniphilus sp. oral taxon 386 str. F0131]
MIYLIAGNSGSGKSTQANILNKRDNFYRIITYTTRAPRVGEKNAIDYFFVDKYEFKRLDDEEYFVGITEYAGNFYGIPKLQLEKYVSSKKNVVLVIDLFGVIEIKNTLKNTICIYLKLSKEEMIKRMEIRGDLPQKIKNRVENAQDFSPYADYILDGSKNVEEIAKEIDDIVEENSKI